MHGQGEDIPTAVVMLSADQECVDRVRQLYRMVEGTELEVLSASDPAILHQMLPLLAQSRHVAGLILDLTPPHATSGKHAFSRSVDETARARYIGMFVAAGRFAQQIPLLIVSAEQYIEMALSQVGVEVVARIGPDEDDVAWRSKLSRLLPDEEREPQDNHQACAYDPSPRLDFATCTLYPRGKAIMLTAREATLLHELLRATGHYLSATELARRLTRPGAEYLVDEHGVEQTICRLRQKLGESARQPQVLLNKRGLGYAICRDVLSM